MRVPLLAAAVLVCCGLSLAGDQKLTPESLVKLHVEQALQGWQLAGGTEREIRGECTTTTPARAAGALVGPFRFISSPGSSRVTVNFGTPLYEGESFAADGQQAEIGFAQPRTSSRSALGVFLNDNRVIVGEGLLGGVLNARWPLADVGSRQAKLSYDGLKKLNGRQLHRLRYRAKQGQGRLEIAVYLEPDTYRHVATVYTFSQAQGMGVTPEKSSSERELNFRLEESFSGFEPVGRLTLPKTWLLRYERSTDTSNEWTYEFKVQGMEERPIKANPNPNSDSNRNPNSDAESRSRLESR